MYRGMEHGRNNVNRYIAPVLSALVVMALAAGYAVFFFLVLNDISVGRVVKVIITLASLFVIIGVAAALISRIKELRRGQEDDLGKY